MDSSGQTDIYRYDINDRSVSRITTTPESEYSPTVMPGAGCFSAVRVESDGTQRLWQFDLDGTEPRLVLTKVDSVGYHTWVDDSTLGLFVLGEPHTLRIADRREDTDRIAAYDIGRSLHTVPGEAVVSFVHLAGEDEWWITLFDPETWESKRLVKTLPQSQDFVWTPGGDMLMAHGSRLFRWSEGNEWTEIADLDRYGLQNITRLAVSPQTHWLALVADDS
jgi:Tol biopolymer transport system component